MKSLTRWLGFSQLFCVLVLMWTGIVSVRGGNVLITNYNEDSGAQLPVSLAAGAPLLKGGSVQIGSWTSDPSALIAGLTSPADRDALLASFVAFGTTTTIGNDVDALYQVDRALPIAATNPLVGWSIYTLIGNATTLSTSSELAIIRHASFFAADAPVFAGTADISDPTATVLFGQRGGPAVTTALGAAPSLQLGALREAPRGALGVEDANGLAVAENATQSFGVVPPGTAVVREFRVRNQGGGALNGMAIQLDGLYVSSFRIDRTQLPAVLLPGTSGTFTVTFNPVTSATKSATVSVVSSTPGFNVFSMPVSGTGDSYFLTQPVSRTVTAGQPVTFSAVAGTFDGSVPAYQWFRNGVALPGATGSTLTVSPAQPWHSGEYAVQVPGSAGPILSETANLRINGAAYGPWQGLVSYYPFDASPADAVRPASPAELINASQWVTDSEQAGVVEVVGRGFAIPPFPFEAPGTVGPGGYIRLPRPVSAGGEAFTFSFWLKEQGYSSRHGEAFLTLGEGLDSADVLGHYWIGGGDGVAEYYGSMTDVVEPGRPGVATIGADGVVVMNEPWTAWTLVARDGVMRVYRQGTYRGQVTYPVATMGDFYIGRHWWVDGGLRYSTRLRARVNDVRVFNRALNDADVFQLYSQLSPPPEPGTFEAWSTAQGLTGNAAEASADPDRDGFTNLQEYSFGTIPRQSTPALSDFRVTASSSIVDWLARPDVQYGAFSSLDLVRWGTAPFPITTAPNQAQVPAGYQRLQLELPLLDPSEGVDLFAVRIKAEALPVFNPGAPVTLTPATGEVAPGEAISLSGPEAVNAISYQWYKNDVAIPEATRRTLELPTVTAEQTGSYSLMALNAAGQTRSAARFLNVRSPLPAVVTTGPVMNVTGSTALASGTVNSDGGAAITSRGVVVGPAAEPTLVTGTPVSVTPGTGTFAAPLSPLQGKTTYYVRAFATTSAGTTYGSQVVFSTAESTPVVLTGAAVTGATFDTFTVSGEVTDDGGTPVTRRGIVYGLSATPTLGAAMDAPATGTGDGNGAFSSTLTGLSPETSYYARAYATSTIGTGYGADIIFKTAPATPTGFSLIPAGVFQMGDSFGEGNPAERPLRQVTVSAFYMAQRETTKALWDEVRAWGVSRGYTDLPIGGGKAANHPVHTISWFDVIKWCNARSEKEGLTPCYTVGGSPQRTGTATSVINWTAKGYRLPTEAEWEKAARGGLNGKRFPWGDTIVHSQANYYSDSAFAYDISPTRGFHPTYAVSNQPYTSPVGSFAANDYGLYDMSGNLFEWCWDWYGNYDTGSPLDPRGASSGPYRVFRGGSGDYYAINCRVAYRNYRDPSGTNYDIGFRVARSSAPIVGQFVPTVLTGTAAAGATFDTFTVSGEVTDDGGTPVTRRGIVYGLSATPTLGAAMDAPATGTGDGNGAFSSTLTGLSPETSYYARAYATSTIGTGYGADITFKTAPATPTGFSLIPAGVFQMGDSFSGGNPDERPLRQVTVSAFYMAQRETTKALWDEVRAWGVSRGYTDLPIGGGKAANHPVHTISWFDVIKWCNARSEKEGLTPCYTVGGSPQRTGTATSVINWTAKGYRLPTEAEWEKAARGGLNGKRLPWGDTIVHSQANYYSDSAFAYDISPTRGFHPTYAVSNQPYTSPVGSFAANDYGLYDMSGNVWEWCWDWYGNYDTGSPSDPLGASSGSRRVGRGGGWDSYAIDCRVASRGNGGPSVTRSNGIGFRVARSSVP